MGVRPHRPRSPGARICTAQQGGDNAGPDEALAVLRRELPRPLRARLAGQLHLELFATEAHVLAAVRQAGESIKREADKHLVDELLTDGAHAVIGLDETLPALAEGRVHVLVVAETFGTPGARCATCGRLVVAAAHSCPACGQPTVPLPSLREAVLEQARDQGARIEFVGGVADRRLADHGGIGAWTRF